MTVVLTRQEISALAWAVQQSSYWGGYHSGDASSTREFERRQAAAEAALAKLHRKLKETRRA